jgi:uncharacterized protein YdeI (BOF family)
MKKLVVILVAMFFVTSAFSQTKTEIKPTQLPKNVAAYLAKNFSAFHVEKAFKIDNKGKISTEVNIVRSQEKFAFTFDKDAKLIKKETIKSDPKPLPGKNDKKPIVPGKEVKKAQPVKK